MPGSDAQSDSTPFVHLTAVNSEVVDVPGRRHLAPDGFVQLVFQVAGQPVDFFEVLWGRAVGFSVALETV